MQFSITGNLFSSKHLNIWEHYLYIITTEGGYWHLAGKTKHGYAYTVCDIIYNTKNFPMMKTNLTSKPIEHL